MCEAKCLFISYCERKFFVITTDEVEERVDIVGNLEEDESSSVGDSEQEETDLRVQQEVREIVLCTLKWELNIFLTVHKHFHMVVRCQCCQNTPSTQLRYTCRHLHRVFSYTHIYLCVCVGKLLPAYPLRSVNDSMIVDVP